MRKLNLRPDVIKDKQFKKLVDILRKHKLISDNEVKEVMSMEPFAQLTV